MGGGAEEESKREETQEEGEEGEAEGEEGSQNGRIHQRQGVAVQASVDHGRGDVRGIVRLGLFFVKKWARLALVGDEVVVGWFGWLGGWVVGWLGGEWFGKE